MKKKITSKGPPPRKIQINSLGGDVGEVIAVSRLLQEKRSADDAASAKGRPRLSFKIPRFDSVAQMAGFFGIPLEILRDAKKSGCDFILHDRPDCVAFFRWWWETNLSSEERENWTRRDKRAAAMLKEHDLDKKRKRVVDRDFVVNHVTMVVGGLASEIDRLEQELPATLKGRTEVQIRNEVAKQKKAILKQLNSNLERFVKEATD